ncbi:MAG: hypothetical protein PHS14_19120 [Elusimicrobia bacterium]|nr:hypothetical protein [Elusimicrobiota bacterium]
MSGTPLARPSAWRLWWSFTWRQAAAMVLSTIALGIVLGALKWLGMPPAYGVAVIPYFTLVILIYSGYEAFRRLLVVYDIRFPGGPSDEQDHRQRR